MAQFVGQGGHLVEGAVEVHLHEGVHTVDAVGVGPGLLALVRVDVDPAVGEGLGQALAVVGTQGGGGLEHQVAGLLEGVLLVHGLHGGGVHVAVVHVGQAQHPRPQAHEAMEGRQVGLHGGHQVPVDGGVDGLGIEGGVQAGGILPDLRLEEVPLDVGVQEGGEGVLVLGLLAEVGLHDHPPVRGDLGGTQLVVVGGVEDDLLARGEGHGSVGHVHVVEHAGGGGGRFGEEAGGGGHPFLALGEDVGLHPQGLQEAHPVRGEAGVGLDVGFHLLLAQGHEVGVHERELGAQADQHGLDLALHLLVVRVAQVHVALVAGVAVEAPAPEVDLVQARHEVAHGLGGGGPGLAQGVQGGDEDLDGVQLGAPGGIVLVHVRGAPLVDLGHLGALGLGEVGYGLSCDHRNSGKQGEGVAEHGGAPFQ